MRGRTFSKAEWDAAQLAWRDGEFSDEWREIRHHAAMRGMIYPPDGTRFDSWEDDAPSPRAMLVRAIRETPKLLLEAIGRSKSWGEVVAYVIRRRDDLRDQLARSERDDERRRAEMQPTGREAASSIKAILSRIGDS